MAPFARIPVERAGGGAAGGCGPRSVISLPSFLSLEHHPSDAGMPSCILDSRVDCESSKAPGAPRPHPAEEEPTLLPASDTSAQRFAGRTPIFFMIFLFFLGN